ncbi:SRPBCC family protein [Aquimarina sediminis]|uniref:SRPBCC family protein n=1 Tax=Aquimarina sediminis TaxID=2070536 RepID=UPI0019D4C313|nr:SRPBCC domain-containing protein [Aquimarina sediminis]
MNYKTLTITKSFNAPIEDLWLAWAHPKYLIRWWAPEGMKLNILEHHFEIGKKWKYSMPLPNGDEFVSEGIYKEISKHKKIITSADFKPMTENVELQVYFKAEGDTTQLTFKVIHPTEEYCKQQEEKGFYTGWGGAFERLNFFVNNINLLKNE